MIMTQPELIIFNSLAEENMTDVQPDCTFLEIVYSLGEDTAASFQ